MSDSSRRKRQALNPADYQVPPLTPSEYTLVNEGGAWAVYHLGKEYIRLLSATSKEDAESQIAEMLLLRLEVSYPDEPAEP